jgi:hypothetical protein
MYQPNICTVKLYGLPLSKNLILFQYGMPVPLLGVTLFSEKSINTGCGKKKTSTHIAKLYFLTFAQSGMRGGPVHRQARPMSELDFQKIYIK